MNGKVVGLIVLEPKSHETVKNLGIMLKKLGVKRVILATGDPEESDVRRVFDQVKADTYFFGMTPRDKKNLILKLKKEALTVTMIGDGVNDLMALTAAHVGVGVVDKKSFLVSPVDTVIFNEDVPTSILRLKFISNEAIKVIKQNYAIAALFNSIGIFLALIGFLNPILASILHHFNSIFVVSNATRLLRINKKLNELRNKVMISS